jgi:hypothetical protein
MPASIRTPEREIAFLAALSATANVLRACEAAGIGRTTAYDWRDADEDFRKRWDRALEIGVEALEDEAVRRAHEGWEEPVMYQGQQCATVRKYSDTLLIFLLKGRKPERYRERVEHSGKMTLEQIIAGSWKGDEA